MTDPSESATQSLVDLCQLVENEVVRKFLVIYYYMESAEEYSEVCTVHYVFTESKK